MNTLNLICKEVPHRKINFLLSFLPVETAVTLFISLKQFFFIVFLDS
jgi:hypothetical protein